MELFENRLFLSVIFILIAWGAKLLLAKQLRKQAEKSGTDKRYLINNIKNLPFYVIWGGGAHTEFLYQTTSFFHSKTESKFLIVDSDELKHGKSWRGIKIYDTSILKDLDWKDKGLIISSYGSQNQIKKIALDTGISKEHLVCLYENITRY